MNPFRPVKRKVDVNDNLDVTTTPAPPPSLRARRLSFAGALPATATPFAPFAPTASSSLPLPSSSSLDHADALYNNYIGVLALKLITERAAAKTRLEVEDQLSRLQNEQNASAERISRIATNIQIASSCYASATLSQQLPMMLDGMSLEPLVKLETLTECVNNSLDSLQCTQVKPMEAHDFGEVQKSLIELQETFHIQETIEDSVNTAVCLRDIGELMNVAVEENKSLDQLKDREYRLLAQNFSSNCNVKL